MAAQHVLIFGATGGIGTQLVAQALARGHRVTALARRPDAIAPRPGLTVLAGDVLDAAAVDRAVSETRPDAVLSALGARSARGPMVNAAGIKNIVSAMKAHGPQRLLVVSSIGVADAFCGWFVRKVVVGLFLKQVHEDLKVMERHVVDSGLDFTLVRPPQLVDTAGTGRYRVQLTPGRPRLSKLARADVADFMLNALEQRTYIRQSPAIGY